MDLRIDFQIHTNHSPSCGWMRPEAVIDRAKSIGLDGVALTDHNTMSAIDQAHGASSDDLLIIPGEEIDTPQGQLIGLFISEPIDPWQSPGAVIEEIHDQGGIVYAPHPFDALRDGFSGITELVEELDAIEVLNSRCIRSRYNKRAEEFATTYGLPKIAGSDAHFAHEIGNAYTRVRIEDENTEVLPLVKAAILDGRVSPEGGTGSLISHAGTKGVKLYNRLRQ